MKKELLTEYAKNLAQISKKNTYIYMSKQELIFKLIKVCSQIDTKNNTPSDEDCHYSYVQVKAMKMLTNKQIIKLLKENKKLLK